MRPSRAAGRPSCLAVEPRNLELSTARRVRLLAAFDSLDEDTRADLLELVETLTRGTAGGLIATMDARDILKQVYAAAGREA